MRIRDLQRDWDAFGRNDPFWAVLTHPGRRGGKWRSEEFFQTGTREVAALMGHLESLRVPVSRRKALDFGCGVGRLSQALAAHFDEVHGVDVSASMITLASQRNRYPQTCTYHLNTVDSLALFAAGSFSFAYSNITLQHMAPVYSRKYIREFLRVLEPGGLLVFQLPSHPRNQPKRLVKQLAKRTLLWSFRRVGYMKRPVMLMHGIWRQEVVRLLEENRAKVLEVQDDHSAGKDWVSFRYVAMKT